MKKLDKITDNIIYIGTFDKDIDLFENQYIVPEGISYNSYLIKDEKYVIMDTVDNRKSNEWINNLEEALDGKTPDYLVISHMESDHADNIETLAKKYPEMKIIGNSKTFIFLSQFFNIENIDNRKVEVTDGEEISIGKNTLKFITAPMVHWPEVMVTYVKEQKLLFSADGFGKFGSTELDDDWLCEARRYYFNICGKFGASVQILLKKLANLNIEKICPLHGPIITDENISFYVEKYDTWSKYEPEDDGVMIAYASIHGNTEKAAKELYQMLKERGIQKIQISNLAKEDWAEAVEDAFRYSKLVLASSSYDGGVFTPMQNYINLLQHKNYQNRTVGIIENGTWAPSVIKNIKPILESMKNIKICDEMVTIKSSLNNDSRNSLSKLADELI